MIKIVAIDANGQIVRVVGVNNGVIPFMPRATALGLIDVAVAKTVPGAITRRRRREEEREALEKLSKRTREPTSSSSSSAPSGGDDADADAGAGAGAGAGTGDYADALPQDYSPGLGVTDEFPAPSADEATSSSSSSSSSPLRWTTIRVDMVPPSRSSSSSSSSSTSSAGSASATASDWQTFAGQVVAGIGAATEFPCIRTTPSMVLNAIHGIRESQSSYGPGRVYEAAYGAIEPLIDSIDQITGGGLRYAVLFEDQAISANLEGSDIPILGQMQRLSFKDLATIAGLEKQNSASEFNCQDSPFEVICQRILRDELLESSVALRRYSFRFPTFVHNDAGNSALWVPQEIVEVFVDPEHPDLLFNIDSASGTISCIELQEDQIGVYVLVGNQHGRHIIGVPLKVDYWKSKGGRGEMRCDPVDEVDYRWDGHPEVAYALGLASQFQGAGPVGAHEFHLAQLSYYKTYRQGMRRKRNEPKLHAPRPPDRDDPLVQYPTQTMGEVDYANNPIGVPLWDGSRTPQQSPGSTMLRSTGFSSASALAKTVIANDPVTAQWRQGGYSRPASSSSSPSSSSAAAAVGALAPRTAFDEVRTDQEWCHLIARGDGGQYSVDNLVSGSKHCNSEQLAIELGQRSLNARNLAAHVEAFLVPNAGYLPRAQLRLRNAMEIAGSDTVVSAIWQTIHPSSASAMHADDVDGIAMNLMAQIGFQDCQSPVDVKEKIERFFGSCMRPWPVAARIRYRIFYRTISRTHLVFSHVFDAQSEGFDINEFNILQFHTRWTIARNISLIDRELGMRLLDDIAESLETKILLRLRKENKFVDMSKIRYQLRKLTTPPSPPPPP